MSGAPGWLHVRRGEAPLIVSVPHAGTQIPADIEDRFVSLWQARKDADWSVHLLYGFAQTLGATMVRTSSAMMCSSAALVKACLIAA